MLRYRFKWNKYYGFEIFYGKEGALVVGLWVYEWDMKNTFTWRRTGIQHEIVRDYDFDRYPKVYWDHVIGSLIREYDQKKGEK